MKSRPHYYNPVKCRPDYFDWLVEPLTDDPFIRKNLQNKNRTRKSIYGNRRVLEDYPYLLFTSGLVDYTVCPGEYLYIFKPIFLKIEYGHIICFIGALDRKIAYQRLGDKVVAYANGKLKRIAPEI